MPIIIQHNPSPGAVGLAAYTSGVGQANERKRKEQQAQLQQMYGQRFQFGMNQLRYGQEQQLAQDRFLQQKQWQDARDEREFGQKQQMANAEARARGEPLPFPGQQQGQQQGDMTGRVLPGGRQVFEGPDTTVDPNAPPLVGPNVAGGGMVGVGPMTPFQQRQELARQERLHQDQLAADRDKRAGIRRGDYALPPELQDTLGAQIRDNNRAIGKLYGDKNMTEADRARMLPGFLAEQKRLADLEFQHAQPVPKKPLTSHKLDSGAEFVETSPGQFKQVTPPKTDTTTTMTAAQSQLAKQRAEDRAAEDRVGRAKERGYLEDQFANQEDKLRKKIAKEVGEGSRTRRVDPVFGLEIPGTSQPASEQDAIAAAEKDPELKAEIDRRMEDERKKRVDDRLEDAYPTPKAPPPSAPQQTPAAPEYDLAPSGTPATPAASGSPVPPSPAATSAAVDPNLQRLIDAARAGNTKAQQALQQGGIQWQQ